MGWYGNDWGMGGWVAVIGGLVIFAGVMIFRRNWRHSGSGSGSGGGGGSGAQDRGASEILKERYARGEIDREEYEARMAVLCEHAR